MRFISYSELLDLLGSTDKLKTTAARKESAKELDPTLTGNQDFIDFLNRLTDEEVVFLQWIEQNPSLKKVVNGEIPPSGFKDGLNWLNHGLFADFSRFVSPYLVRVLLQLSPKLNLHQRAQLFSYAVLLQADDRSLIDRAYFLPFRSEVDHQLQLVEKATSEEELLRISSALTTDTFLSAVNSLSRSAYNERIHYIDSILRIVKHPKCTSRLAGRILRQLENIELNPEHQQKITELEQNRKKGKLVSEHKKTRLLSKAHRKTFIGLIFFLVLLGSGIYLFTQPKESPKTVTDLEQNSSFEQFNQQERRSIDSLLRLRQKENAEVDVDQDQYLWAQGSGVSMAIRQPLINERMEQLYSDWIINAELHFNQRILDCSPYQKSSSFTFPGVDDLLNVNGNQTVTVRNETDYAVAVFCFEEKSKGKVSMTLIKKGKQVNLQLSQNDHLLFVAGNDPAQFDPKKAVGDLPSFEFTSHFCSTDNNLYASLSMIYKLSLPSSQRNKIMLRGDSTDPFFVADLYGILETIW